jgi:hypothetical protein
MPAASARVVWERMRPGLGGLDRTVDLIVRAIREGAVNEVVRERALRIVNRVPSFDHAGEMQAVWDFFTGINGMPYRLDPVDVELVQGGPAVPLGGDCDCFAAQIGMTLEAIGHPTSVVPIGRWAPRGKGEEPRFHHVWVEDRLTGHRAEIVTDGKGTVVDPVLHQPVKGRFARPGDEMVHELEMRRNVPMRAASGGGASMLSQDDPKRIVAEARSRAHLHRQPEPGDYGIDYGRMGYQPMNGFFEDLVNGARQLVAKFDPTNPKAQFGGLIRGVIQKADPTGGGALVALDQAAKMRADLAKAGVDDPNKITPQTAKVVDNALNAGASVALDTTGTAVRVNITQPPVPVTDLGARPVSVPPKSNLGLWLALGSAAAAVGVGTAVVVSSKRRKRRRATETV